LTGLIDDGETAEQAAIREVNAILMLINHFSYLFVQLKEETGYEVDEVLESSPVIVSDPGMTNANMRLVVVSVTLEDKMETPQAHPDAGEFIVTRVLELSQVSRHVHGYCYCYELGL